MSVVTAKPHMGTSRKPKLSGFQQWWVLTLRSVIPMVTGTEMITAILSPVVFSVGFYLPLKYVMNLSGIPNYGQFLMPLIVLQSVAFVATSAAFKSAVDAVSGMDTRLKTLPIPAGIPLAARMTSNLVKLLIVFAASLVCGFAIGFRFNPDAPMQSIGFCLFSLLVGLSLAFGADAIGTLSKSPEITTQALMLPTLILGMLSGGFVPVTGFPEWIQPFVRNQPITQFALTMRAMTGEGVSLEILTPALIWAVGLIAIFAPLSIWASLRRE